MGVLFSTAPGAIRRGRFVCRKPNAQARHGRSERGRHKTLTGPLFALTTVRGT